MPSIDTPLHALSSTNVVLGDEVVAATIVYSPTDGTIVKIIRKDEVGIPEDPVETNSDGDMAEYYDEELEALGVEPDNHRDIGDLVLMPGLVDAHVHLNEVSHRVLFPPSSHFVFCCDNDKMSYLKI